MVHIFINMESQGFMKMKLYKLENNFDKYLIEEKDTDYRYSIPLIMFLFHECF